MINDTQDIRFIGGIRLYIPITCLCINISNMALCGIPFLSGFYSKDLILEIISFRNFNFLIFLLYYISTGLTIFYTIRLTIYLIINDFNLITVFNLYDEDYIILKRILVLLFIRLFRGRILIWLMFYYPYIIYLPFNIKIIVIYVVLLGLLIGYIISNIKIYSTNKFLKTYSLRFFLCVIWFIPGLRTYGIVYYFFNYGQKLIKNIDLGWRELYRGWGIYNTVKNYSIFYNNYQINNFKIYLFRFVLWIIIFLLIYIY